MVLYTGNVADIKELPKLLREDNKAVFGDRGYNEYKQAARKAGIYWGIKAQPKKTSEVYKTHKQEERDCQ